MFQENHEKREPSSYGLAILRGLQSKPMYQGTVDDKTIRARRAAAKVGRKSRAINRQRSK